MPVVAPVLYTPEWLKSQEWTGIHNQTALLAVMAHLGIPNDMVDIGCGDGHLCRFAARLGVTSVGLDIAVEPGKGRRWQLFPFDLRVPIKPETQTWRFKLAISWEVGEHLPEESADVYAASIARHVGRWLVFTAAIPGQSGEGHINCQPPEYWREKLEREGLAYDADQTERLRETWRWTTGPMFWLPQNVQVFRHD